MWKLKDTVVDFQCKMRIDFYFNFYIYLKGNLKKKDRKSVDVGGFQYNEIRLVLYIYILKVIIKERKKEYGCMCVSIYICMIIESVNSWGGRQQPFFWPTFKTLGERDCLS